MIRTPCKSPTSSSHPNRSPSDSVASTFSEPSDAHMDSCSPSYGEELVKSSSGDMGLDVREPPLKRMRLRGKCTPVGAWTTCNSAGSECRGQAVVAQSRATHYGEIASGSIDGIIAKAKDKKARTNKRGRPGRPIGSSAKTDTDTKVSREGKRSTMSIWTKMQLFKELC